MKDKVLIATSCLAAAAFGSLATYLVLNNLRKNNTQFSVIPDRSLQDCEARKNNAFQYAKKALSTLENARSAVSYIGQSPFELGMKDLTTATRILGGS